MAAMDMVGKKLGADYSARIERTAGRLATGTGEVRGC